MSMDYEYQPQEQQPNGKSWLVTMLLAWFFGPLGVHRFYTGHTLIGVIQLVCTLLGITSIISCIWALVDIVAIALNKFQDANDNELSDFNPGCGMIALIVLGVGVLLGIIVTVFGFMGIAQ